MVVLVALTVAVFARGMKGIAVEVAVVDVGQAAEQAAGQPGSGATGWPNARGPTSAPRASPRPSSGAPAAGSSSTPERSQDGDPARTGRVAGVSCYWASIGRTLAAWGPLGPWATSNSTAWPSFSER